MLRDERTFVICELWTKEAQQGPFDGEYLAAKETLHE